MITFIIDGNNLIGKIPELKRLQGKDKYSAREKLLYKLDSYFTGKKNKVHLHLDGFPNVPLRSNKCKITYSYEKQADDLIRIEISNSSNPKLITLVTSDFALAQFAKKSACKIIKSETFARDLQRKPEQSEEDIIRTIDNKEILRMFLNGDD